VLVLQARRRLVEKMVVAVGSSNALGWDQRLNRKADGCRLVETACTHGAWHSFGSQKNEHGTKVRIDVSYRGVHHSPLHLVRSLPLAGLARHCANRSFQSLPSFRWHTGP